MTDSTESSVPDDMPELIERVAEVLQLQEAEIPAAFAGLRKQYPHHGEVLREAELVARDLGAGLDRVATVTRVLAAAQRPVQRIGKYRILGVLGEGGMGTVLLAEQKEPVRRRVALKVIKLGMDSKQVLARFELERQALAVMNHPAIAKVFDADITELGQPYFVMELVEGVPLTEYCDAHRLTLAERIKLMQKVCQGVQHAHQKGVLHRDLKPANILVTRRNDEHVVKIIDFGLARATDHQLIENTIFTERGQLIGTPEYMSPEQAGSSAMDLDTRTDIYSLGVILYQLLTGELPFSSAELRRAGLLEVQRIIQEVDPVKPSTRFSTIGDAATSFAERRRMSPGTLRRHLRGDLDWIVMKAMSKEPERRYDSATNLGQDLDRYLSCEPVLAGPPSAGYRLGKLARKYRTQVTAALLVFTVAIVGAVVAWIYAEQAIAQERLATAETARFDRLAVVLQVEDALAEKQALLPAWPENTVRIQRWLKRRGEGLRDELPRVRLAIAELEARNRDPASDAKRRESDRFLLGALKNVEKRLAHFLGADGAVADVRAWLWWSERIDGWTRGHPNARVTWQQAAAAIAEADGVVAHRQYEERPIELTPQTGLVPIGMNPVTKLWEFYHLRSAWDPKSGIDPGDIAIPRHDVNGLVDVQNGTGIVFVLVPGGDFTMGSQKEDPQKPNYDPSSRIDEPLNQRSVPAYFIGRHELSQGQWKRLSAVPHVSWGTKKATHPVNVVSWNACHAVFTEHGLLMPTSAQWEYAARAGTDTIWFPGNAIEELRGYVNVLDESAKALENSSQGDPVPFDDGYAIHAPVDHYRPNDFGLHNVHGNVWEWCEDFLFDLPNKVYRGGGFRSEPRFARSAAQFSGNPSVETTAMGVRPARALR